MELQTFFSRRALAVAALLAVCKAHGESQSPLKAAGKMGPMGGDWIKVIREGLP